MTWSNTSFLQAFIEGTEGRKTKHGSSYILKFPTVDFFMYHESQGVNEERILAMRVRPYTHDPKGMVLFDRYTLNSFTNRLRDASYLDKSTHKHFLELNKLEAKVSDVTKTKILDEKNHNVLISFGDEQRVLIYNQPENMQKHIVEEFRTRVLYPPEMESETVIQEERRFIIINTHVDTVEEALDSVIPDEGYWVNGFWLRQMPEGFEAPDLTEEDAAILADGKPCLSAFGVTNTLITEWITDWTEEKLNGDAQDERSRFAKTHYKDEITAYVKALESWREAVRRRKALQAKEHDNDLFKPVWSVENLEPMRATRSTFDKPRYSWHEPECKVQEVYIKGRWMTLHEGSDSDTLKVDLHEWHKITDDGSKLSYSTKVKRRMW